MVINFRKPGYQTDRNSTCFSTSIFYFDPERVDPFGIAIKDQFTTVFESIINHTPIQNKYNKQKVSEMKFLVRWNDFTEAFNRILP